MRWALSALPQLRVYALAFGLSCLRVSGPRCIVRPRLCGESWPWIHNLTHPPTLSHDGFLTVELEDKCPPTHRPAETFMKPYDPLLHLMYPNKPLWLLSSLASP